MLQMPPPKEVSAVPQKWAGIYPPALPPPKYFNLDKIADQLKDTFKKDRRGNPLHDETGKVNLPTDNKGILMLDPASRTRILDPAIEQSILLEYRSWIYSARKEAEAVGAAQA